MQESGKKPRHRVYETAGTLKVFSVYVSFFIDVTITTITIKSGYCLIELSRNNEIMYTWHCCCVCLVSKLCLTVCDPMDCSPLGYPVHGISQPRILEWVAISFSRGIVPPQGSNPHSCALVGGFFTTELPGKPVPGIESI